MADDGTRAYVKRVQEVNVLLAGRVSTGENRIRELEDQVRRMQQTLAQIRLNAPGALLPLESVKGLDAHALISFLRDLNTDETYEAMEARTKHLRGHQAAVWDALRREKFLFAMYQNKRMKRMIADLVAKLKKFEGQCHQLAFELIDDAEHLPSVPSPMQPVLEGIAEEP